MIGGTLTFPRFQPHPRAARKSEWLRSTLAHHHCPEYGVENEIVVLATGIDQYLQEVFHHLAHPNTEDTISAEDFRVLCSVLGLDKVGDREEDDEFRDVCSALPYELSFKDFHSRLCGYFRGCVAGNDLDKSSVRRLPLTQETELVEREIRLRWPRVRRKCVNVDPSMEQTTQSTSLRDQAHGEDYDPARLEADALRELVEDLRSALQGSDARCLSLEVALRNERTKKHTHTSAPDVPSIRRDTPYSFTVVKPAAIGTSRSPKTSLDGSSGERRDRTRRGVPGPEDGDPILRELRLIRASRDGQLEEAIRFNRHLEEELGWAYQEVRRLGRVERALWKENAGIRRRAEEAREALKQGLQRVRLIQKQAQSVPQLQHRISQLETQVQHYRSQCTYMTDTTPNTYYPIGGEDTCSRTGDNECLQRAVEGRAASDGEEEDKERGRNRGQGEEDKKRGRKGKQGYTESKREDSGQCCLMEVKEFITRLHSCGQGCHNTPLSTLLSQQPSMDILQHSQEEESGAPSQEMSRSRLSPLEDKVADALVLLLQLCKKNVSCRALEKTLTATLDANSRRMHGPSPVVPAADALRILLKLSSNELLRGNGDRIEASEEGRVGGGAMFVPHTGRTSTCQSSNGTSSLVISC